VLWDGVETERRRRIVLAVRRGETLPDAEEAALAVRYANAVRRPWLAEASVVLILLFWLALHLVVGLSWLVPSTVLVCAAAIDAFLRLRLLGRVGSSSRANATLLAAFGLPVANGPERLPRNPYAPAALVIPPAATIALLAGLVALNDRKLLAAAGVIGTSTAIAGGRLGLRARDRAEAGAGGHRAAATGVALSSALALFWTLVLAAAATGMTGAA
jgi:hypothetical protein